jgi:hypothetical protein
MNEKVTQTEQPVVADEGVNNPQYDSSVTTGSDNSVTTREAEEDDGWSLDIEDLIEEGGDEEDSSTKEGEETTAEEGTPKQEETKEEPVQQQEPPKEEEPAQQETPKQETPAEPSKTPEEVNALYKDFFDKSVDLLAEKVYVFDDATKEALDTNPSAVLPRLAAQLHMQVMSAALTQVYNMFPTLLNEHQGKISAAQEAEDAFYSQYPQLKEHRTTVDRIATVYRQANPQERDREKIMSEIAAMAMVQARVPLPGAPQPQAQQMKPVVPTSARGGTTGAMAQTQKTEWDELVNEED